MDNKKAKEILALYRPGSADQDDVDFAEALVLAKHDPELSGWFKEHCALQEAVGAKFKQISAPEGLREQILSERKVQGMAGLKRKAVPVAILAAVILLLAGIASFYFRPHDDRTVAAFVNKMAGTVLRTYPTMDLETNDLNQIRQYLAKNGGHGDYSLSKPLAETSGTGCKIFPWHGKTVSMVCFNSKKSAVESGPDLFLFVINRSALSNPPASNSTQFTRISQLAIATWTEGNNTYVLGGLGDEGFVRRFL